MEQQYGDDFISITDEDGKEYELEVLAELEHEAAGIWRSFRQVPATTRQRTLRSAFSNP